MKKLLLSISLAIFAFGSLSASNHDSVIFKFAGRGDGFYNQVSGNSEQMRQMLSYIDANRSVIRDGSMKVYVDGYSTSQSSQSANLRMSKIRSNKVKSEMITRKGLRETNFVTENHALSHGSHADVVTVQFGSRHTTKDVVEVIPVIEPRPIPSVQPVVPVIKTVTEYVTITEEVLVPVIEHPVANNYHFALRTNLLYDLAIVPNLGLEVRFDRLAFIVAGGYSKWSYNDSYSLGDNWYFQPEIRVYTGIKKQFYIGGEFHMGDFDIHHSYSRRNGDMIGGGLTLGYTFYLNRSLNLDIGCGFGYTKLDYDLYDNKNDKFVKEVNKEVFTPTKLEATLVWKLGRY